MPRGKKKCDKCDRETGVRTKVCPKCGTHFMFKPKSRRRVKTSTLEDWQSLQRGQIIKAVQGYGPYHLNNDGDRVSDGYTGLYKVRCLEKEGIGAYPVGRRHSVNAHHGGYCFIYMGPKKPCKIGLNEHWEEPHKIKLEVIEDE